MPNRRSVLAGVASLAALRVLRPAIVQAQAGPPAWQPGSLEIHHIATGRGNSTLVLFPDRTSLLIDAGEAHSATRTMSPARPDDSRRAGEWIARYADRQLQRLGATSALDLVLITHLHPDHLGELTASAPPSPHGPYRLTGLADVADLLPIRSLIDRGWPDYRFPAPTADPSALNYIALARSLAGRGTAVAQARPGSLTQLRAVHDPARFPALETRILTANTRLWTGTGEDAAPLLDPAAKPTENMCSIALRLRFGDFRYYTGGDLTCDTDYGRLPAFDIESPTARRCGPVSVAAVDHHGYFDAAGPDSVRALQPRAWILPTWHASHPAMGSLANLLSSDLYPGDRLVFATDIHPAALLVNDRFASRLGSTDGHIIVRVAPDTRTFTVDIATDLDESGRITHTFGPFPSAPAAPVQ